MGSHRKLDDLHQAQVKLSNLAATYGDAFNLAFVTFEAARNAREWYGVNGDHTVDLIGIAARVRAGVEQAREALAELEEAYYPIQRGATRWGRREPVEYDETSTRWVVFPRTVFAEYEEDSGYTEEMLAEVALDRAGMGYSYGGPGRYFTSAYCRVGRTRILCKERRGLDV